MSCRAEDGQRFRALLDSGSVGNQIANYISNDLANRLDKQGVTTCNCNLARTCTVVGCFTSDKCITLRLQLSSDLATLDTDLDFRIVQGLSQDCIIGYESFRQLDLSQVFRHLFEPLGATRSDLDKQLGGTRQQLAKGLDKSSLCLDNLVNCLPRPVVPGDGALHACECALHSRRVILPNDGSASEYREQPSTAVSKQPLLALQTESGQSWDNLNSTYLGALSE